tara:strand:- start:928 stop:1416 length:489 start_codon:yes stop_codon:yes gene_type:complete
MNINGRVNILGNNVKDRFNLYEKVPLNKKSTSYDEALTGSMQANAVSRAFFSVENIDSLQQQLIKGVHEESRTRFQIGKQDEDTLKIIMRSIFLQNSRNLPGNIQMQINELNKHVLDYAIPQIIGEAEAYIKYKNDVSTLAVPLSRPVSTYNSNILSQKTWF